ncbi:DUF4255 domain-containing protein [uncultured Rhodoblastus sp.]|uniref:DUF4255 domain-containing protein n=1 Tax=uncultured Rhodoblastus sp. TaxID=543037 RepID=UPI0025FFA9F9|nr:DUF4255 domain-containing protein [uncultured Rhodoblastus sp.]
MSSALAIAAAARVISRLIDDRVAAEGLTALQGMRTSVVSPEQIDGTDLQAKDDVSPKINIFPYHVGLNAAWRNAFEPARDRAGQPVASPPLAIDVSFLVSAHGTKELISEVLLGLAMQALSDSPQLTRDRLRALLQVAPGPPAPDPLLLAIEQSRLADQFELLRIVPMNLSADDMQKLWTSIHSRYRPSFCYSASALLIDTRNQARDGFPVRDFAATTIQYLRPRIERVEPVGVVFRAAGNQIALIGQQLRQDGIVARFANGARSPLDAGSTDARALIALPADLPAGVIGVELVRALDIGAPPVKDVNESNLGVFLHQPIFKRTGPAPGAPDIVLGAADPGPPPSRPLDIRLLPPPLPGQDVRVLLNEIPESAQRRGYSFPGDIGTDPLNDPVRFNLSGMANGTYLARVRVDGAETPLDTDASGGFNGPTILVN